MACVWCEAAERECGRAEGVGLAEGEARAAKRPQGPKRSEFNHKPEDGAAGFPFASGAYRHPATAVSIPRRRIVFIAFIIGSFLKPIHLLFSTRT